MDLFTYLLAKNDKFSLAHKNDLFAYLLGKNNSIPLKTAEGVTITIEALKTKINELKMTKESTQETTQGYNIFPYAPAETKTQNGITIISDGKGTYTINGTATDRVDIYFNLINEITIPVSVGRGGNGKLYLFNKIDLSSSSVNFMEDDTQIDYCTLSPINRTHNSYGVLGGKVCNGIKFYIPAGVTVSNGKVSPMFTNDGDTTHDFEPYTGGIPAPNPSYPEPVINVEGYRNLLNGNLLELFNSNQYVRTYNFSTTGSIVVKPNTTYSFIINTYYPADYNVYAFDSNDTKTTLSKNRAQNGIYEVLTITTNNDTETISLYMGGWRTRTDTTYLTFSSIEDFENKTKIMFVEGDYSTSTIPSYVPYGSNYIYTTITDGTTTNNYTIPLNDNIVCGIGNYKDELIVDKNGHCYLKKVITKIDSYNGETITTEYMSTTGGLDIGATIYYVTPSQLIDLNYTVDLKLFIGENNISNSEDMMMTLKYY